eukprot:CAMPEP_0170512692 /NCGR_PEP_ID=MMETSP0208-20121228/66988_1 /TAXON_ID=197538 /ORGANISM="Strombidium inclinatum, Strain S3" /LENGTH=59 /DNA_ID=CAMNT_0010796347 /DNA_START=2706 /DNA_END=2885 /DNA_ORIENTATION=+
MLQHCTGVVVARINLVHKLVVIVVELEEDRKQYQDPEDGLHVFEAVGLEDSHQDEVDQN